MMRLTRFISLAAVICLRVTIASAANESDLQDIWINVAPTNYADDMLGNVRWISLTIRTNNAIDWVWERDGVSETHSGRYSLQPVATEKPGFRERINMVIIPATIAVRHPVVLRDITVNADNRYPITWTVLKCEDIGGNRMVFLRQMNYGNSEQAVAGYPPQGVGSPEP